jgi:predicted ATPase
LTALVERLAGAPLLLLTTYRPGYHPPWLEKSYATQVALTRLSPADSRRIVQAVPGSTPMAEALMQAIIAKAEGNPLFIEELARVVVEAGAVQLPEAVPATLEGVLAARLDRLPPAAKHVVQVAAVIGQEVPGPLLQAVLGWPEAAVQESLAHLQATEFLYETCLVPAPVYTFKHVLTQAAAYQALLLPVRQELHAQIVQAVEARFPKTVATQPELVAHHYTEAGLYEAALPYWQQAGQQALGRSAYVEAIGHLSKGLEGLKTLPDTPEHIRQELDLQTALGAALIATKGYAAPEVEHTYARARELCRQVGETPQLVPVLFGLRLFYQQRAEFRPARELEEQLFHLAQRVQDPALRWAIWLRLALIWSKG